MIAAFFHPLSVYICVYLWLNSPVMDSKTLKVLEYPKILTRLSDFCDFSASKELAGKLQPSTSFESVNFQSNQIIVKRFGLYTIGLTPYLRLIKRDS